MTLHWPCHLCLLELNNWMFAWSHNLVHALNRYVVIMIWTDMICSWLFSELLWYDYDFPMHLQIQNDYWSHWPAYTYLMVQINCTDKCICLIDYFDCILIVQINCPDKCFCVIDHLLIFDRMYLPDCIFQCNQLIDYNTVWSC